MTDKQKLVSRLLEEGNINVQEASMLLTETQTIYMQPENFVSGTGISTYVGTGIPQNVSFMPCASGTSGYASAATIYAQVK